MIFIACASIMVILAAAAVALPLWRGQGGPAPRSQDIAQATQRMQIQELERDLASGVLAETDYRAARRDIEQESTDDVAQPQTPPVPRHRLLLAVSASLCLLVLAACLYWGYGNWRVGVEGVEAASVPAVEQMVADLSAKLHSTDGGDLQGWQMLGHAYVIMEKYPEAVDAFAHAQRLTGDSNADVLAGYAEAMTLANPGDFMDKALPLFEKALALDPRNPQALWYGGLGAFQRGDKKTAVARWQALLAQDPPAQYKSVIQQYIVQAGGKPEAAEPQVAKTTASGTIHLHVSLASALQGRVRPDETLFVFAQTPGVAGGPPLAARRLHVSDLPLDLVLSDQDAVLPGRVLSGQADVQVTARISAGDTPLAKPGDYTGKAEWKKASGDKPLAIVIDTVVQ